MSRAADLEAAELWPARACLGLEQRDIDRLFFTKGGRRAAAALCGACVALAPCRARALAVDRRALAEDGHEPVGYVAGLTAEQRASLIVPPTETSMSA